MNEQSKESKDLAEINNNPAVMEKPKDALGQLAARLAVSKQQLENTLKKTAFSACKSNEEFIAGVIVANTYQLNPLLKELYVFPGKGGGVVPIVPLDGWVSLVNRQPDYDGHTFEQEDDESQPGGIGSITCKIYIKGRSHPCEATEYMRECYQGNKEPWKNWPIRMLRHKAYIQCARLAFGFSGLYSQDEADRIAQAQETAAQDIVKLNNEEAKVEDKRPAENKGEDQPEDAQISDNGGEDTPNNEDKPFEGGGEKWEPIGEDDRRKLLAVANKKGVDFQGVKKYLAENYDLTSTTKIPNMLFDEILKHFEDMPDKQ